MSTSTLEAHPELFAESTDDLTVKDRCDRCGAQAFTLVKKEGKERLLFCAHHGRAHTPALLTNGFEVLDFSHRLNEKPTDPDIDDI